MQWAFMQMVALAALVAPTSAWVASSGVARPVAPPCAVVSHEPRCSVLRLQSHDDDDDDDEELTDAEVDTSGKIIERVELKEPGTGDILPCYLAAAVEYEGDFFAALYPVDAPVCLAQMLNDERLVPLDEDLETDAMIEAATKACAQNEIELLQTPVVLTARGPGLENPEAFNEALEYAENGEEEETEEALVLAELQHDGHDVLVVQTLDPLYVVGKKVEDGKFLVPTDEEIDSVSETIEALVMEFEEAFEDDSDDDFGP